MRKFLLISVFSLALFGLPCAAEAAEKPAVSSVQLAIRTGEHKDYDRIVFDAPRSIPYQIIRKGTQVTVKFGIPATINLRSTKQLDRAKNLSVKYAEGEESAKKLSVNFTVAPKAVIKDFTSGLSIVLDIYGSVAPETAAIEKPHITAPKEPEKQKLPVEKNPAPLTDSEKPISPASEVPPTAAIEAVPVPPVEVQPLDPITPAPTSSSNNDSLPEITSVPKLVATLDPKTNVGAAIFSRATAGYIIFDRKIALTATSLAGTQPTLIHMNPLDFSTVSGFSFAVPEGTEVRASRIGTEWQIFFNKKLDEITVSTGLVAQPDFALGARLFLPTTQAPDPVKFHDPIVGDDLIVLPLRENDAFSMSRRFADMAIVPAAQGLVIKPLQEKLSVRSMSDGIEITAEGGMKLSPAADTGTSQQSVTKTRTTTVGKLMFDINSWKGKPNETFNVTRQKLMQTIVDVPESQRNLARLELARFYFSHGMGAEALSMLSLLTKFVPSLPSHYEFIALRGVSKILVGQSQEGLQDLSATELTSQPEIYLWQAVGLAQMRDWKKAEEKFNLAESLLIKYPEPFYSRFSVLAVESAIAANKEREATDWLTRLETSDHRPEIKPALLYLRGVLRSKSGFADMAESLWKEVTKLNDRLYKIRAELALIDLGVATKSLTPAQAVERLEGLRFAWRGDDLELDILHRLGSFYVEAKNFRAGLVSLAKAVSLYPDSSLTPPIKAEMAKTFRNLFLSDAGADLNPVDALTLYQDYSDLIPSGPDGITVVRNLADRLVAIDLLDQAAKLLDDQLKSGVKGEDKAKIGTKLAVIHLLNNKPDAALSTLDASQEENLPEALQTERRLLRSRTLSEQKKFDEALDILKNNESLTAKLLRADITMKAQRWSDATKAMMELIGPPPKPGHLLSEDQAQWLVNCAIAMSLGNDLSGLDRLAIDYGAAMAGTTQSDTFRVLTRPEKIGQMRDIAAAQAKITEVDMFRGFLDSYRNISSEAKKPTDKAN